MVFLLFLCNIDFGWLVHHSNQWVTKTTNQRYGIRQTKGKARKFYFYIMPLAHVKCFIHFFFYLFGRIVANITDFFSFLHLFKVDLLNALIRLRDLLLYAQKILQVQKAKVNQPFQQKHQEIFVAFFFSSSFHSFYFLHSILSNIGWNA